MVLEFFFVMVESWKKKCRICGLVDGNIFINCLNKCKFCGDSITRCNCLDFSLVRGVMDFEIFEKKSADMMSSISKRKAGIVDLDDW